MPVTSGDMHITGWRDGAGGGEEIPRAENKRIRQENAP